MPARRRAAARGRGGGNGPLQIVVAAACWGTTGVAGTTGWPVVPVRGR